MLLLIHHRREEALPWLLPSVRALRSRLEDPVRKARWRVTGKFFRTNQRKRISTESPKRCFLMRPMSLTPQYIEIICFLLISLDLLSLIFVLIHDRSRSRTEELFSLSDAWELRD